MGSEEMRRRFRVSFLALFALSLALLAGCQAPAGAPATSLKVGLLPIVDALPAHVAAAKGLFAKHNVKVELVTFVSAVERDSALQAKQIDGQLNDLVATLLLAKGEEKVKVVRQSYQGSPAKPMMYVFASPQSQIRTPADLKGVEIGVSTNSVIEYTTEAMLRAAGLRPDEIKKVEVSKIPVRLEMLLKGQLAAATLPDPFAALAQAQGARLIVDDGQTGVGQSVLTFRAETLKSNASAVRSFLAAYEEAVALINASPDEYKPLLVEQAKVPEQVKDSFTMPAYPPARVPTEAEVNAVSEWMVAKGLLSAPAKYGELVTSEYLPAR